MRLLPAAIIALLICGTPALAQIAGRPTNPFAKDPAAIAAGMAVYNSTCTGCHGAGAIGASGPALDTGNFRHGADDYAIFQVIRGGLAGTQMPNFASLSADNVWRIVTYLKSLSARPAAIAAGDANAGQSIFFGKGGCTACHEINGSGLDLATDLSAEGIFPATAIRAGVLHQAAGPAHFADVTLADGKKVNGLVRAEDSFSLLLEQRDGKLLQLDKKTVRSIGDPSPAASAELVRNLTAADIDNLVAYLGGQQARNLAETAKLNPPALLPYARIAAPEARGWASPRGTLEGNGFSALTEVTAANAARLQARWSAGLGAGAAASTPIAANGILYVSGAAGAVYAFDARSGLPVWQFLRQPLIGNAAGANRGVALLDGRIFVGTSDNKLIALDARNGRMLWEKQTAEALDGYAMTGAPLALRTRVIVGVAGTGPKARGWLDAYDPATGTRLWRLNTAQAAGAMTAAVGAYEAANTMLYWSTTATANGGPEGDSVLAINANSGAIVWRHALKAGAGGGNVVLPDMADGGKRRALLLYADAGGQLSLLDRADGKPVLEKSLTDGKPGSASISFDRVSAALYAGLGETVLAADARTGRVLWRTRLGSTVGGVLATRGGMVFVTTAEGQFIGLDAKSGKVLWHYRAGGPISASPISYAVDGKQYIAVTAGTQLVSFALPN